MSSSICISIFSVAAVLAVAVTSWASLVLSSYAANFSTDFGWLDNNHFNIGTTDPCNWHGITCNDGDDDHVVRNGSAPNVSPESGSCVVENRSLTFVNCPSFGKVVRLELAGAGLVGSIPPEIAALSKLTHLDLSHNNLTGELPPSLGSISKLKKLDISHNRINSSVPPQLGNLKKLVELNLSYNNIYGPIPSEIGLHMKKITSLSVSHNQINGQLPFSLTSLTHLIQFDASNNEIDGSIPDSIGKLKRLHSLSLSSNKLNGPLPLSLFRLTNLTYLSPFANQISGSIPPEIGNLSNLHTLILSDNCLAGPLPSSLDGPLPPTLGHLSKLIELSLESNKINGSIPSEIGNLKNLVFLGLEFNQLTGQFPSSLCGLTSLQNLHLSLNKLSGSIPFKIGYLRNLTSLKLSSNNLIGPLVSSLGGLESIQEIDLSGNHFNGSIPTEICFLSSLTFLDLSCNSIAGEIPSQLGNLTSLITLNLANNSIVGEMPSQLGNLPNLTTLNLAYNSIVGEIPYQLGNLKNLTTLNLAHNNLNGSILYSIIVRYLNNSLDLDVDKELCGNLMSYPSCSKSYDEDGVVINQVEPGPGQHSHKIEFKRIIVFIPISVIFILSLLVFIVAMFYKLGCQNKKRSRSDVHNVLRVSKIALACFYANPNCRPTMKSVSLQFLAYRTPLANQCFHEISLGQLMNTQVYVDHDQSDQICTISVKVSRVIGPALVTNNPFNLSESMVSSISIVSFAAAVAIVASWASQLVLGSVEKETKALLESGWWSHEYLNSTTTTPCNLIAITCNAAGSVTHISMNGYNLYQTKLGRFLNGSSFPNLVSLNVDGAGLIGSIPPEIATLSKLTYLDLSGNYLTGELPPSLGNLAHLVIHAYDISYNRICGSIPPEIRELGNLTHLDLSDNELHGPLPQALGHLSKLKNLHLMSNGINGSIPPEIGNLKNLEILELQNNHLTGALPSALCDLTNLRNLSLGWNQLGGSMPSRIGDLKSLRSLQLCYNRLTGPIVPSLGGLENIELIDLSENLFNGSIPIEICSLSTLTRLDLSYNSIVGQIPFQLFNLTNLTNLNLAFNNLNGNIPSSILQQSKMISSIYLDGNNDLSIIDKVGPNSRKIRIIAFTVSIILVFSILVLIIVTVVRKCGCKYKTCQSLTPSPIAPSLLGGPESIKRIDLSSNHFNGSIPTGLYMFSFLNSFLWTSITTRWTNAFSATFNLTSLTILNLVYNNLSGSLPSIFLQRSNAMNSLILHGNKDLCTVYHKSFPLCFQAIPPSTHNHRRLMINEVGQDSHKIIRSVVPVYVIFYLSLLFLILTIFYDAISQSLFPGNFNRTPHEPTTSYFMLCERMAASSTSLSIFTVAAVAMAIASWLVSLFGALLSILILEKKQRLCLNLGGGDMMSISSHHHKCLQHD
ncbi:hypothetical protein FEM48_Zijuj04G0199300 [Ziziphus jujuba var. spinosa]|uniref:non-specific serine/threonine protein kinase n=1 Tax=Ziziphus jujuba var. spinosa TaxID=714518 RepID=A0A978VLW0_ZIZJJ|nr:hypothetical protein FEM48_Zijuj04G0199300 [Ziziphus jujuba var. spinosa]